MRVSSIGLPLHICDQENKHWRPLQLSSLSALYCYKEHMQLKKQFRLELNQMRVLTTYIFFKLTYNNFNITMKILWSNKMSHNYFL